jgi:membrane fusion protein, macrolide-specific efflux system
MASTVVLRGQSGFSRVGRGLARRAKRPLIVIPVIALIGSAVWLGYRSGHRASATAASTSTERLVTVSTGTIRQTVAASGTLQPTTTSDLNFAVSGQVTAVNVKAGQTVTKGTVLATINSAALQSQVAQAQATVASAQAKLSSDTTVGASSAQLAADQANLAAANGSLATTQAALAGATLAAPINGTVSLVNLTVGEQLGTSGSGSVGLTGTATGSGRTAASSSSSSNAAGSASTSSASSQSSTEVEVISTGSFVVNLNVDDTQISKLAVGQSATLTPSTAVAATQGGRGRPTQTTPSSAAPTSSGAGSTAAPASPAAPSVTATGTVSSVGTVATSTSGVATFPVVVSVSGSPSGFYAGATVQVAVTYKQLANVVEVPTAAISQSNQQSTVTVSVNGAKSTRVITTGASSGGMTQVVSGLNVGDQVVVTVPAATGSSSSTGSTTRGGAGGTSGGFGGGFPGGSGGGLAGGGG